MTAVSRPIQQATSPATAMTRALRAAAAAVSNWAAWFRVSIHALSSEGQLGPDAEQNLARWTGART